MTQIGLPPNAAGTSLAVCCAPCQKSNNV